MATSGSPSRTRLAAGCAVVAGLALLLGWVMPDKSDTNNNAIVNVNPTLTPAPVPVVPTTAPDLPTQPPSATEVPTTSTSMSVTTSPAPTTSTSTTTAASALPPVGYGPGKRPFRVNSSWNTPLPSTTRFSKMAWPTPSPQAIYWVNWEQYAPAIHVSKPTDPVVYVKIPNTWNWPAQTLSLRIPPGITGASGTDGEILIVDGDKVHNMWQFKRTSLTSGTAAAYGRTSLTQGDGWGDQVTKRAAGIVATGSSQLAGLLTKADVDSGKIQHALALVVAQNLNAPGFTGRALGGDGKAANGIIKEGQRAAIPPSTAMPAGLTRVGKMVFTALKKYGAYDIDTGGSTTTLIRAQTNAFDEATIDSLRGDMPKILPLLQLVN